MTQVADAVRECAAAAHAAAGSIAAAGAETVDAALLAVADRLLDRADAVLAANKADVDGADLPPAMLDRLRLDAARLDGMAHQLRVLAEVPHPQWSRVVRELPGALVEERRKPVGVVGANFEARPNVVVDIASQLLKSRNAGVLRTGSAAIGSAAALLDEVIAPALGAAGLDPAAIQLVRLSGRDTARALVAQPDLVPLVILRGSGDSTRELTAEAARHGVRTLAHADGGGVLYLDRAADAGKALDLVERSLDRLGVCNRLNLLLVHPERWDELLPGVRAVLDRLGVAASLPPHDHPLGLEWALQDGREATVTIAPVDGPAAAARLADAATSGLAAGIATEDAAAAAEFLDTLRRDRRVLERHHPAAGRVQAARRAGDRDQRRPAAGAARAGHVPRPASATVRRHGALTPATLANGWAPVAQTAEAGPLKGSQCGFDSHRGHLSPTAHSRRGRPKTLEVAAAAAAVLSAPTSAAAASCVITALPVPEGTNFSRVNGVDPTGRFLAGFVASDTVGQAAVWHEGALTLLSVPLDSPRAGAVNAAGVVVGTGFVAGSGPARPGGSPTATTSSSPCPRAAPKAPR